MAEPFRSPGLATSCSIGCREMSPIMIVPTVPDFQLSQARAQQVEEGMRGDKDSNLNDHSIHSDKGGGAPKNTRQAQT